MDGSLAVAAPAVFDPAEGRTSGLRPRLLEWLLDQAPLVYAGLRAVRPNLRVCSLVLASRREDVEAILANTDAFQARSGTRLAELQTNAGIPHPPPISDLGSDGTTKYDAAMQAIAPVVLLDDVAMVTAIVRDFVRPRVAAVGSVDLGRLLALTPAHLAREYFGLKVENEALHDMALCSMALVDYAFGTDKLVSPAGRLGRGAAARISAIMRQSIAAQQQVPRNTTVIGRLLKRGMAPPDIEAMLTVLMMALVAVPTIATMNIAHVLLRRPAAMRTARAAALAEDDVGLGRCLVEALRFKPGLPGLFRTCAAEFVVASGTRRAVRARKGDLVLPLTHSAMFDGRRVAAPRTFDPGRPAADALVFGWGRHRCTGFAIGRTQLVQTLKPLLQRGLSQTGADRSAISYFAKYPEHFPVHLG